MGPITPDDLRFNRFGLSSQESRVLALAMSGRIDKQIASEMGISLGTVRVYWKRIRMKVGGTRSEVIAQLARTSLKLNFEDERSRSERLSRDLEDSTVRERSLRIYETAFETISIALAILDGPGGNFLRVNRTFAGMHGYDTSELANAASSELMPASEATKIEKAARKAAKEGKPLDTSSTRRRKDGSTFTARVRLSGSNAGDIWVLSVEPQG